MDYIENRALDCADRYSVQENSGRSPIEISGDIAEPEKKSLQSMRR